MLTEEGRHCSMLKWRVQAVVHNRSTCASMSACGICRGNFAKKGLLSGLLVVSLVH